MVDDGDEAEMEGRERWRECKCILAACICMERKESKS